MAREHPDYRDNIELLNTRFPDYDMLTITDVMTVFGIKSRTTARKQFEFSENNRISKAAVAKRMCG